MDFKNYFEAPERSLFHKYYYILETDDFYSDEIFYQNRVKAGLVRTMGCAGQPFLMILCKIRRIDEKRFFKSMEELKKKILLCTDAPYGLFCQMMEELVEKYNKKEHPGETEENSKVVRIPKERLNSL